MSTDNTGTTRRPGGTAPALALAVLLSATGCADPHRWVGPAGLDARGADLEECRYEAQLRAERDFWFERQQLQREAWWARRPADRAMANARIHQLEMIAALGRQQAFDGCMSARGYVLQRVAP